MTAQALPFGAFDDFGGRRAAWLAGMGDEHDRGERRGPGRGSGRGRGVATAAALRSTLVVSGPVDSAPAVPAVLEGPPGSTRRPSGSAVRRAAEGHVVDPDAAAATSAPPSWCCSPTAPSTATS